MEKLTEQDGKSPDIVNENLEALKGIFPFLSFWHSLSIPSSFSPLPFCKDQGLLKDLRKNAGVDRKEFQDENRGQET